VASRFELAGIQSTFDTQTRFLLSPSLTATLKKVIGASASAPSDRLFLADDQREAREALIRGAPLCSYTAPLELAPWFRISYVLAKSSESLSISRASIIRSIIYVEPTGKQVFSW
jgi:hypothetical protein